MSVSQEDAIALLETNQEAFGCELEDLAPKDSKYRNPRAMRTGAPGFFDVNLFDPKVQQYIDALKTNRELLEQKDRSWAERILNLERILLDFRSLYAAFNKSGNSYLDNENNANQYQNTTRQIYPAMALVHACFQRMIKELNTYPRTAEEKAIFNVRYQELLSLQQTVLFYPSQFLIRVNEVTNLIKERQIPVPGSSKLSSLRDVIRNLNNTYNEDYNASYGNSFWRWIKELFKKDYRAQQIQFLANVSDHPDCTDLVRKEAMELVNSAIMATEAFGSGSRLGAVLRKYSGDYTLTKIYPKHLTTFLNEHDGEIVIPESLSGYYQENKERFNGNQPLETTFGV